MATGKFAPGHPGHPPTWTSGAKSGVGTAIGGGSRVWFSISHGTVEEVYYPRVDLACIRDCLFLITDGKEFFSDERTATNHEVAYIEKGIPAYRLINTCKKNRYRIEKIILTDPGENTLLVDVNFTALKGQLSDYHLFVILSPHLLNYGYGNTGWIGDHKGTPMLFAQRQSLAVALGSSVRWINRSTGFVGVSDGWHDIASHKRMTWSYERAEDGNVALTGEVDIEAANGRFLLVLGFGEDPSEAGFSVKTGLFEGIETSRRRYTAGWKGWQEQLRAGEQPDGARRDGKDIFSISMAVMRVHEAKSFPGAIIASLSVPWGEARSDKDLGGYHLVWTRDMVEAVSGLLSAGIRDVAVRSLRYLQATQDAEGKWPQNMWLSGKAYWGSTQMDEAAFPVLLLDKAWREGVMGEEDVLRYWPMVRQAISYIVKYGPVTPEDRWEKDGGYSPFTVAVEIAALLAGADIADAAGQPGAAGYMRETADNWNVNIERWLYVTGSDIDKKVGVEGHYVRIGAPGASRERQEAVLSKGRGGEESPPESFSVGPDALALVRYGLRTADDTRITNTVKVVDAYLRVETKCGPAWRRYPGDHYGEHADGSPYDDKNRTGIGRAWPLLVGERGHYEVAAGNIEEAKRLLKTMESFSNEGGMIPEQVWDAPDIPGKELYNGRPTRSGMPLVWAHAEYVKLRRSIREGRVYDMPPHTVQRYQVEKKTSPYVAWRFNNKLDSIPAGKPLRVEVLADATVRWSDDGWRTVHDTQTRGTGLGVYIVDIPGDHDRRDKISFTFYWREAKRWEGVNFEVKRG